jgi:hypothetical protein
MAKMPTYNELGTKSRNKKRTKIQNYLGFIGLKAKFMFLIHCHYFVGLSKTNSRFYVKGSSTLS